MPWHVLQTHVAQELRLRNFLVSKNVIALAPREKFISINTDTGRQRITERQFLPRYVIACVNLNDGDQKALIKNAQGLHSILEFAGKPATVAAAEIAQILSRIKNGYVMLDEHADTDCGYKHGDRIVKVGGSFDEWHGVFDKRLKAKDRVHVLLRGSGLFGDVKMEVGLNEIRHVLPEELQ